jgi:hypothetical protein
MKTQAKNRHVDTELLSVRLRKWSSTPGKLDISGLEGVFGEKSFAIALLLLMALPSLPVPTGGITHVFEVIAMLIGLEMIGGAKVLWLPKRWKNVGFSESLKNKMMPFLIKRVTFVEKYSKPRMAWIFEGATFKRFLGLLVILFSFFAFSSPPFSGLDTLFALGVVLISLSILLDDIFVFFLGLISASLGGVLLAFFATLIINFFKNLFH